MAKNDYPTVISFYTPTWQYPTYGKQMQSSCGNLGLNHHIVQRDDTGNWLENTRLKPQFIYATIQELKRSVLWVDVDGSILKLPELLKHGYPYDFAARPMPPKRERKWHVGTMYFNYTDATLAFLKEWNEKVVDVKGSDELALDLMWQDPESSIHQLHIGELPATYFEMLRGLTHAPSLSTIVCHRASKSESKMEMKKRLKDKKTKDVDTTK